MKKLLMFLLVLSAVTLLCACVKQKNPQNSEPQQKEEEKTIFKVTEHGVIPNAPEKAAENTKKLSSLLKKAKKNTVIFFPEGNYYLESPSYGCINLSGKKNIILEGENATIINASYDPTIKQNTKKAG